MNSIASDDKIKPAQAREDDEGGDGEDDCPDEEDDDRHLPSLAEVDQDQNYSQQSF